MPKFEVSDKLRDELVIKASHAMHRFGNSQGFVANQAPRWPGYQPLARAAVDAMLKRLQVYEFDNTQAQSEGWSMFEVDGRYQLQRDDESNVYESDAAALMHVAIRASNGSAYHREALECIGKLVPEQT